MLCRGDGVKDHIFQIRFNQFNDRLVVLTDKAVYFCSIEKGNIMFKAATGFRPYDACLCIGGLGSDLVTGTIKGDLVRWKDYIFKKKVKGHKGPVYACCNQNKDTFLTGGADGFVKFWNNDMKEIKTIDLSKVLHSENCKVRAIAYHPRMDKLAIGTRGGEIFQLEKDKPENHVCIVKGHYDGLLWGLCVHPKKDEFVTVGEDFL